MKTKILTILRNTDSYVSGQELCEKLGVSRTAVWKVMNQLKESGYEIEAVQNRGYAIRKYPEEISAPELESRMRTECFGREVHYFDEIDSTNIRAKRMADEGAKHGTLIVADMQTTGRGRRGRNWQSPSGTGIWMSLILKPDIKPANASMITLVMALSVARAIEKISPLQARIKWPNDIVVNKKKICGILTEMSAEMDCINHIVIGIGINVNTTEFPEELREHASSLMIESGTRWNRNDLIPEIMKCFEEDFAVFCENENLKPLRPEYEKHLINLNQEIRVLEPGNEYNGMALGINDIGELIVRTENGQEVNIYSGEVSVRGLYGYV